MFSNLTKFYSALISFGNFLQPFFLLAVRLFWGWQFFKAGFSKFDDMEKIGSYFGTIGIPVPLLSAYAAATIEMVGGLLLLIGFASRLVAIPLMITMTIALLTAHFEATSMIFDEPMKVIAQDAFIFLMATLTIFVFGPGLFSVDEAIKVEKLRT